MFEEYSCADWIDKELKEIIENEIVYNEDLDSILYDEDWELFKNKEFTGGEINGENEGK